MTETATDKDELDPEHWLSAHGDALYRYALLRLRDPELAEEMVQDTFVAALRARDSFAGRSSMRTWLIGILKRKVIDHYRRRNRERPISELIPEGAEEGDGIEDFFNRHAIWAGGHGPGGWSDPQAGVYEEDFQRVLADCLRHLPGRQADAFVLREIEQMESEEIRQVLGITPTNLWAMLHRARLRLRECIEKNWLGGKRGKV